MSPQFDLVIRGGTVVDGTGRNRYQADVAINGTQIAAVGTNLARGKEEIDASGLLVTPGFVDVHTHFDGQATWDERMWPTSQHGVTTAVIGNCGVGFAPCRPRDRDTLIALMEGVEDIPGTALHEGLRWDWESFPQYLDALERRRRDIDIAALLPHGPLRVYVMGERAVRREAASASDLVQMQALVAEGLRAGAVGLSTSRTMAHRDVNGEHTPMFEAAAAELTGLGHTLRDFGGAVFQMISDFDDARAEFDILRQVCRDTGQRGTLTVLQHDHKPRFHEQLLDMIDAANAAGERITGQVICRPVGVLLGFDTSMNPFSSRAAYAALEGLPLARRMRELARPEVRASILGQSDHKPNLFMQYYGNAFDRMFPMAEQPDYLPPPSASVAAMAAAAACDPLAWLYDFFLQNNGASLVYLPLANYSDGNADAIERMLKNPWTLPALGDGGAHVSTICDGSATTFLLMEWVRKRQAFSLEQGIHMLTQRPATLYAFADRGVVAAGMKADLNLIDFDALAIGLPQMQHDLPAGGRRLLQSAQGYRATLVSGQVTYRDGVPTSALPGKLVRRRNGQT